MGDVEEDKVVVVTLGFNAKPSVRVKIAFGRARHSPWWDAVQE